VSEPRPTTGEGWGNPAADDAPNVGLLSIRDLTVRYGGVIAVDSVSLDVEEGSFVGLIGPNGAGKTTLIDAVCGFCSCRGAVTFENERIDHLPAHARSRRGLARTFQAGELFDDLTVADNILVGSYRGSFAGAIGQIVRGRTQALSPELLDLLDRFGLVDERDREVRSLSVGMRKLVAVARALAARPRLVLLDEPAAGLDSTESHRLGETLLRLPDIGVTVVLVDHDVDLVLGVCDVVHVLDTGRVIASGPGDVIRSDPNVMEAYLGTKALEQAR